jgi:hypothetical protein
LRASGHDKEDPGFWIFQRLPCLVLLEMSVLDALSISSNPLDGDDALSLIQKPGRGGKIRKEEKRNNPHQRARRSKDQENVHPPRQACGDVTDSIANQPAEHCGNAVRAVVRFKAKWLFRARIPHAHDQNETGIYS